MRKGKTSFTFFFQTIHIDKMYTVLYTNHHAGNTYDIYEL